MTTTSSPWAPRAHAMSTLAALALVAGLAGCGATSATPSDSPTATAPAALTVTSTDFVDGGGLALEFAADYQGCPGDNVSPQLEWSAGPEGTVTYAVTLDDPDAGNFSHWVAFDIPANVTSVGHDAWQTLGTQGRNAIGTVGYFGPCPPAEHHYTFTVYALDVELAPGTTVNSATFARLADGHVLATGTITGVFPAP